MEPVLKTKDLQFLDLIRYPDMELAEGRITFIGGDSGSGKSTLLKLFNGLLSPSSGSVFYQGRDLAGLDSIEVRRQVLLAAQSVYLFDASILGNFTQFYQYRELPLPPLDRMRFFLDLCRADFPLEADCRTLSGGERQRVYNAIFLSFSPKVFMLDEPTSALDAETAVQFLTGLKGYCAEHKVTLIIVSHDQALVSSFADQIITLQGGPHARHR